MDAEAGRRAAYADLVAAVLDLRSPEATRAFDAALSAAVAAGALPDDLARQLRWLQRQSERAVVEHAETVLPPALVALQRSITPLDSPALLSPASSRSRASRSGAASASRRRRRTSRTTSTARTNQSRHPSSSCRHAGCSSPGCDRSPTPPTVGPFPRDRRPRTVTPP